MRALRYFFVEAAASLWRGWEMAVLSTLTIAAGLFVLGFFLMVNANLHRLVGRWTDAAELAVYVRDDATPDQTTAIDDVLERSGLAQSVQHFSKDDARSEFARDFPDLAAGATALDRNPFPASFEIRLNEQARHSTEAIDHLVTTLNGMAGVADVRYDRQWLSRLNATIRIVRGVGLIIILLLAFACALTVANVVRLAAMARRDEIEIMQLVGAPFGYIRGPFVVEGFLQGGVGALVAVIMLLGTFAGVRARYGAFVSEAVGLAGVSFVPSELLFLLIFGGMALGCLGGFIVARGVR